MVLQLNLLFYIQVNMLISQKTEILLLNILLCKVKNSKYETIFFI